MTGIMTTDPPIQELIDSAKSGDREAFDRLASRVSGRVAAFVRSRIGPALRGKLEADDVVQEALLKAFETIGAFRGSDLDGLWKWLASISEHLIWNASRKRSVTETSLTAEGPGTAVSPSRGLRREERLARLERSLSDLSSEQREVILLAKIDGLRAKEIAERTGRTEQAVRQILSRGLKSLREKFGETASLHLPDRAFQIGADDEPA